MAGTILPSDPDDGTPGWSPDHLRLHRSLLRQPTLLPQGARLLLAVSGGQDSMAMTGLLRDLQPLHGWGLRLWHGDHGWRQESALQAQELAAWAEGQQLPMTLERLDMPSGNGNREQQARQWRYGCLWRDAQRQGCTHVLTAHTASDRAETVLLHLARGSHRKGLASLATSLPLASLLPREAMAPPAATVALEPGLVRPLQLFSREDTARICRQQGWPVWPDPSNHDPVFSRNRIRSEVLPVLEALHPGATRRISAQAERLRAELERQQELIGLALEPLGGAGGDALDRGALLRLDPANQRLLLIHWLERHRAPSPDSASLDQLLPRLQLQRGPGSMQLRGGWHLRWQGSTLSLHSPPTASGHG